MSWQIRRVLAAVDGSRRAPGVLEAALRLAAPFGAQVHLFRSIDVPLDVPASAHNARDDVTPHILEHAATGLRALAAGAPNVTIEPVDVAHEQAWKSILGAADRIDADLIVIGSHGFHGWDHVFGTTAAHVADRANRYVLVVHATIGDP